MEESGPSASPEVQAEQDELIRNIRRAQNHYQVLDVAKDCTDDDVRRKYRRLALRLHPDKCDRPEGEEAYAAIDLAHQTLSDAVKRKRYDYLLTLHRGRFRPDMDNHISEGGFEEGEDDAPEGGYIRCFAVSFLVIAATVGLFLYSRLKVELCGIFTKDGLPLHAFMAAFLVALVAGLSSLEVLKWTAAAYFATKLADMVPWGTMWGFQFENSDNMYGVPCWVGLLSVPLSWAWLQLDVLSALVFGLLAVVVGGIAVLRSENAPKWVAIYYSVLFALVYVTGISGGIAAVLALVVFFFGGSMPGATIVILAGIILFFAYKISPAVCMLVVAVVGWYFSNMEILFLSLSIASVVGVWNYGWYIGFAAAIEIVLLRYAAAGNDYGKRIAASVALFVSIHAVGEASILTALGVVLVFFAVCYVLMKIVKLDEGFIDGEPRFRGATASKQRYAEATRREKKEAKKDAKKAGRRK